MTGSHPKYAQRIGLLVAVAMWLPLVEAEVAAQEPAPTLSPLSWEFESFHRLHRTGGVLTLKAPAVKSLGYIPPPMDISHLAGARMMPLWLGGDSHIPPSYDLRAEGRLTPVKNQGACGACWAFATSASIESRLGPSSSNDFSENHMKNTHGFDWGHCDGGNVLFSAAYLSRWSGPAEERDDPYNAGSGESPAGLKPSYHVQDINILPGRTGPLDNDLVKQAVMESGAVYFVFFWADPFFNVKNAAYYFGGSGVSNHAVAVVGWDDGYSADNFNTPPAGDGAFLVKNSWGPVWGRDGFFHLSYYDTSAGFFTSFSGVEPAAALEDIYLHDPLGWVQSFGFGQNSSWYSNVFTAGSNRQLMRVSTFATAAQTTWELFVYDNVGPAPDSGVLVGSSSGVFRDSGYHTIDVGWMKYFLSPGRKFSVVFRVTTPGFNYPVPIENRVEGYSSGAKAGPGESFVSFGGRSWTDITKVYANTNVCIRAFTGTSCDDGLECTADLWDGTGCRHEVIAGHCLIGNQCVLSGTRDPANQCRACDPEQGEYGYSSIGRGAACDNGVWCDGEDNCDGAGGCTGGGRDCRDLLPCTQDYCDESGKSCLHRLVPGWCMVEGTCVEAGVQDPSHPCRVCDPLKNTAAFSNRMRGERCDDGIWCNGEDACDESGRCVPAGRNCDDALECTVDGCDEDAHRCLHSGAAGYCISGGVCVKSGALNPANPCQVCDDVRPEKWGPAREGEECGDGRRCTVAAHCASGRCVASLTVECSSFADECNSSACDENSGDCVRTPRPSDVPCGGPMRCEGGVFYPAGSCDGRGGCMKAASVSCAPYASCKGGAFCADSCASAADCTSGHECMAGRCRKNQAPVADAGKDQVAGRGFFATLEGHGSSDPDGDSLEFRWTQIAGPAVELFDSSTGTPWFEVGGAVTGQLAFELVVGDGIAWSGPSLAKVTVEQTSNRQPVAVAAGGTYTAGTTVTLDGTASADPDGDPLRYRWFQESGPAVVLEGAATARPWFSAPALPVDTTPVLKLIVNDGAANSRPSIARLTLGSSLGNDGGSAGADPGHENDAGMNDSSRVSAVVPGSGCSCSSLEVDLR